MTRVGRTERTASSQVIVLVGVGFMIVSAFLPWYTARSVDYVASFGPISTEPFRPSAVVLLLLAVGGAAHHLISGKSPAIVALAGIFWLGFALLMWYLGIRLQWVLPESVLADDAHLQVNAGLVCAVVSGFLIVTASALTSISIMFGYQTSPALPLLRLLGAGIVVLALIFSRNYRWAVVGAYGRSWGFGSDAIPVLGDVLGILILAAVIASSALSVAPLRWIALVSLVAGTAVAVVSLVAFVGTTLLRDAAQAGIESLEFLEGGSPELGLGSGALLTSGAGVLCALFSLSVLLVSRRPTPSAKNSGPPGGGGTPSSGFSW